MLHIIYPVPNMSCIFVDELGEVYSNRFGDFHRLLQYFDGSRCYLFVKLYNKDIQKFKEYLVHRLIALTFIPTDDTKKSVGHFNGDTCDNRVHNLYWTTHSDLIRKLKYKGGCVYHDKRETVTRRWQARYVINKKQICRSFTTEADAKNQLVIWQKEFPLVNKFIE